MTPIVGVLSEKGGVAKTATVERLAAAALTPPLRILAIDLDPRHSLSVGLGFVDCYDERGMHAVWVGRVQCISAPRAGCPGGVRPARSFASGSVGGSSEP